MVSGKTYLFHILKNVLFWLKLSQQFGTGFDMIIRCLPIQKHHADEGWPLTRGMVEEKALLSGGAVDGLLQGKYN